ncbi:MAG: DUF5414 family protein [Chlamydiia bacterium]|nr:DUF5414 family protein [Chlamydiia bacterium]
MTGKMQEKVVMDDKTLMLFEGNLKRIFALKVSRSTFREIQNVILNCCNQNKELANVLFEILLTGQIPEHLGNEKQKDVLEDVVRHFTIPTRLAKEIYERGDFINIITSDAVSQKDKLAFVNCIRRIDGKELTFMTDPESTLHLIQHFVGRMGEIEKAPGGKSILTKHKETLTTIYERLKHLVK